MQNTLNFAKASTLAVCASLMLGVWHEPSVAASPFNDLRKALTKVDRKLCRSLGKSKCAQQAGKKKSTKSASKKKAPETDVAVVDEQKKPKVVEPKVADPEAESKAGVPKATEVQKLDKGVVIEPAVAILVPTLKPKALKGKKKQAQPAQEPAVTEVPKADAPATSEKKKKTVVAMLPKLPPSVFHRPEPGPHRMPDDALSGEACLSVLRNLRVDYEMLATTVSSGLCAVENPVKLKSIAIGKNKVSFPDQPTLTCGFAARFAEWLVEKGDPATQSFAETRIKVIGTGPGYQCRGRNGDNSGKLSEHAFGNAVDIEYIKLTNGQTIKVEDALTIGAKHQPVLAMLRLTGCQYFTTVLGPGANSAHANHLHLDLERRGRLGRSKLCQ